MKSTAVIFVPGAWHSGKAYSKVIRILEGSQGKGKYTCVPVELPSVGSEENSLSRTSWKPDIDAIRAAIASRLSQEQDILLVVHSYGALPAWEALRGLDHSRIKVLVISGFIFGEGKSILSESTGVPSPLWNVQGDICWPNDPVHYFYQDVDVHEQAQLVSEIKHHAYICMSSPVTYTGWKHVPITYLACTKDNAVPLANQYSLIEAAKEDGADITVETCDASHSPFISIPDKVAEVVERAATK